MADAKTSYPDTSPREPALPWLRVLSAPIAAFTALCVAYALATHACAWATKPWHVALFAAAAGSCGACAAGIHSNLRRLPVDARAERFTHAVAAALAWFSLLVVAAFVIVFAMVKRCD